MPKTVTFYGRRLMTKRSRLFSSKARRLMRSRARSLAARSARIVAFRRRRPGPRSLTSRSKPQRLQARQGSQTLSQIVLRGKAPLSNRIRQMVTDPQIYMTQDAQAFSAASGFQNAFIPIDLLSPSHLAAMFSHVQPTNNSAFTNVAAPTQRLLIESAKAISTFANNSNGTVVMDIYDICLKRDGQIYETNPFPGAVPATLNAEYPHYVWRDGQAYAAQDTVGPAGTYQVLGAQPTDSNLFNTFFRILRKRTVTMFPNSSHQHSFIVTPKRLISMEQNLLCTWGIKGLRVFSMAVIRGAPGSSVDEAKPDTRLVSTLPANIDCVTSYHLKWSHLESNNRVIYLEDQLTTLVQPKVETELQELDYEFTNN